MVKISEKGGKMSNFEINQSRNDTTVLPQVLLSRILSGKTYSSTVC